MARTNVPHSGAVCQDGSEKNFGRLFESYRDGFVLPKLLAVEVFDGGNDRAADILMLCGFDKLIGGTNFASLGDVAEFYGVNPKYVKDAMSRYGIGAKDLPRDVCVDRYYDFIMKFGEEAKNRHIQKRSDVPGTYVLYDTLLKGTVTVRGDYDHKTTYISARLILMLACFLFFGRKIPADSMVKAVFEKLQNTSFCEAAKKQKLENDRRHLSVLEEKRNARVGQSGEDQVDLPYDSDNILSVRSNGDVIMNGEVFGKLLDRSTAGAQEVLDVLPSVIREVLVDVFGLTTPAANPGERPDKKSASRTKRKYPTKFKKPDNWDETIDLWHQHKITRKEAARRTGMSVSSFRNYTVNGKKFA